MKTIEIYGQRNCSFCVKAIEYCKAGSWRFVYRDIVDPATRLEMFQRFPAAATVPQIFIGDFHVGGYSELAALPAHQLQQLIGE